MRLVREGLHHAGAAYVFLDAGVESGHAPELRPPAFIHPRAVVQRQPGRDRHHHGRDQRQLGADQQHQREGAQEGQQRHQQVFRPVMRHLPDIGQVGGDAADQVPGLLPVIEPHRQRLQVVERPAPQLRLDADAQHVAPIGDHAQQPRVDQVHRQQRPDGRQRQPDIALRQQPVDEGAHRHGKPELKQAGQRRGAEHGQQQPPMRLVVGEEGAPHGPGVSCTADVGSRVCRPVRRGCLWRDGGFGLWPPAGLV